MTKKFEKILIIAMALLPFTNLIGMLFNCFSDNSTFEPLIMGGLHYTGTLNQYDSYTVTVDAGSYAEACLGFFLKEGSTQINKNSFHGYCFTIIWWMYNNLKAPSLAVACAVYYFMYEFFVFLIKCLFDVITIIPRMCQKWLEGLSI